MQINKVLETINDITSGNSYLVGGSVRDLLLGYKPRDMDLVVPGSAQSLVYKLAKAINIRPVVWIKMPAGRWPNSGIENSWNLTTQDVGV